MKDEKEGAGNFIHATHHCDKKGPEKGDIAIIVDVDDKNCLAQLTVALKLNHGVRQRLYIVAGALFFVTFFWASKRK